jgi:hypothetical protein
MMPSPGLALFIGLLAFADSPSSELVARLVEQLASPALEDRQAAVREIESLGPAVLPLLPEPSLVKSPAARDSLELLRQRLERRLQTEATGASQVNLDGPRFPEDLLTAIAQQTGNAVHPEPAFVRPASIDVDWHATPFWTAIADLERQTHRQLRWIRSRNRFELVPVTSGSHDQAVGVSGPFRITVRKVESRETEEQRLARFHCVLQAEPRLQPLFVQWPLREWTLQTNGKPASSWNPDAVYELPFPEGEREVLLAIDFPLEAAEPPQRWTLAGRCAVHLAAGREPVVFAGADLRRGATQRRGGITGQIREARFDRAEAETLDAVIRLVVNHDRGGPAFESHRLGLYQRSAWLESDQGQRTGYSNLEVVAEADGGLAMEYHFTRLTAPASRYRFVYEAPTLLLEVPVQVRMSASPPS